MIEEIYAVILEHSIKQGMCDGIPDLSLLDIHMRLNKKYTVLEIYLSIFDNPKYKLYFYHTENINKTKVGLL